MRDVTAPPRRRASLAAVAAVSAGLIAIPTAASAQTAPAEGWSASVESFETGVSNGYQLALDTTNRKVYLSDAQWRSETRVAGTAESEALDWSTVAADATSLSSMRSNFSPYGVAVDGTLDGGTIVTTTARARDDEAGYGGNVVIYAASQGAPTDADRVFEFADGTPIFAGPRRIAVNEATHQAFVTNLGNSRNAGTDDGFIVVLDVTKRGAESVVARVTVPDVAGAVGVTVDEENNLIYVGSMVGEQLYVIDGDALDASDPQDLTINDGAITALPAVVGANARPTYSPELKRLYVSAFASPEGTISVVDADPASATYGELIDTIVTGPTNAVAIDGERGLLYSANLGDQEVVVFDTDTHAELLAVPTSGNAVNLGIDPVTHEVWVSNFAGAGVTDVFYVTSEDPAEPTPEPTEEPTVDPTPEPELVESPYGSGDFVATLIHPAEWIEGEPLEISGRDWVNTTRDGGSTIALKINRGALTPTTPVNADAPDDVWAVIQADADGTFSAVIDYPTEENASSDLSGWVVGATVTLSPLTGSMGANDPARGGVISLTIGAPAEEAPVEEAPVEEAPVDETPADDAEVTWSYETVATLETGVSNGYQLAFDTTNRTVYFTDAKWRSETRDLTTGEITVSEGTGKLVEFDAATKTLTANHDFTGLLRHDGTFTVTATPGTGKLVEFDTATKTLTANHDFTGLSRNDGSGLESEAFDWSTPADDVTSQSSIRSNFSPYGVVVDGTLDGGTIVTTTARARDDEAGYGGNVVIYTASQGAPTDADRVFEFADGTPVFAGVRRVDVNETTHQAFVTNLGNSRGSGPDGFIAVLDLTQRGADAVLARVTVPNADGAVGVAVDEENNLIYVGNYAGDTLYVIDGDAIDTSDPQNLEINDGAIAALPATVGANSRPTYSPELKRLYVATYDSPEGTISVVDADPASATYGELIDTIVTGPTNAVAIDGERGLLYSANLGDQEVVVFDTDTHEVLLEVPTSGNALNLGIDPVTREVWVSNFSSAGIVDVITVTGPVDEEPTEEPTVDPTQDGTVDPTADATTPAAAAPTSPSLPSTGATLGALALALLVTAGGAGLLLAKRRTAASGSSAS